MIGPPGAGKSLAASRLPSILPPLAAVEALEVARIASACGRLAAVRGAGRPFRAPHHTISPAGLVGGGTPPRPGEVTLAHRGVLFLDELCEFRRDALEALRAPLESGEVAIARAGGRGTLPCRFMLVAASNPCPCGRGEADPDCSCAPVAVQRYQGRLSGALADRIDILAAVRQPSAAEIGGAAGRALGRGPGAGAAARERQERRLGPGRCNAEMTPGEARECPLEPEAGALLAELYARQRLSGRAHDRALRLAQTIADLAGAEAIGARADGAGAAAAEARPWLRPRACPECLRRSWLLALLGPYMERIGDRRDRLALAGTAAALQRGSGRGGGAEGRRAAAGRVEALPERRLGEELLAAQCWACCRHGELYPAQLRDAADAPWALIGRGDPACSTGWSRSAR